MAQPVYTQEEMNLLADVYHEMKLHNMRNHIWWWYNPIIKGVPDSVKNQWPRLYTVMTCPLSDVPLYTTGYEAHICEAAKWRLKIGK